MEMDVAGCYVMIKCVCLVIEKQDKLLLVQARNRDKYYFPGGKIDKGETYKKALQRELNEELQLDIPESSLIYMDTVVGEAYPQENMQTELNCFYTTADVDWTTVVPSQEITDLQWIDKKDKHLIAPAVITWIEAHQQINRIRQENNLIELVPYNEKLKSDLNHIEIAISDRQFTKTPVENIELAAHDSERHPTLIYNHEQQCVGFFTLHEGQGVTPYTENKDAIFFRSFSIDKKHRGKGYAKKVMTALPGYLSEQFPNINEIYLTVNNDNVIAQQLYEQCNYQYVGTSTLENRPVYILKQKI